MRIIPFRIEASKEEDNFSDVYAFLIQGTKKDAYEVEIDIDSLNDLGITDSRCTCPHYTFRQASCKHIQKAIEILKEFDIKTEYIKSANFSTAGTDCRQLHTKTFPVGKQEGYLIARIEDIGDVNKLNVIIGEPTHKVTQMSSLPICGWNETRDDLSYPITTEWDSVTCKDCLSQNVHKTSRGGDNE